MGDALNANVTVQMCCQNKMHKINVKNTTEFCSRRFNEYTKNILIVNSAITHFTENINGRKQHKNSKKTNLGFMVCVFVRDFITGSTHKYQTDRSFLKILLGKSD